MVAAQGFDGRDAQPDADVFRRVLDARRQSGGVDHAPEKAYGLRKAVRKGEAKREKAS